MKILVTGATGLLGSEVAKTLVAAGHKVTATDCKFGEIPVGVKFILGDLADDNFIESLPFKQDALVHLAVIHRNFEDQGFRVFNQNVNWTYKLFAKSAEFNLKVVVYASSLSIYGTAYSDSFTSPEFAPFDETLPLHQYDSYALCKEVNERTAEMFSNRSKTAFVGLRFPYCNTMQAIEKEAILQRNANTKRLKKLSKNLWGYLDVRDAAQAMLRVLSKESIGSQIYNFAAPDTTAPFQTKVMLAKFHPTTKILKEIPGYGALTDCSRWISAYGYQPAHLLDRGNLGL